MKSFPAAFSLLFLLPSIHAAALPQLIGSELESTSSSLKRDNTNNLVPRSPKPGVPGAVASMTDDPSLDPSSTLKRDLSARSPQGPASNPGEFIDVGLSRVNPANHHSSADSSASSSTDDGQEIDAATAGSKGSDPSLMSKVSHDRHREWDVMMGEDAKMEHHRHHKWNGTHHEHRKEGVLAEFNSHGEHIIVYNGTHYPNGTSYSPANETMDGGKMLEKVVVDGDEVVVYSHPWNETRHHHHNHTGQPMPTATGVWLPSGTGWIPSGTGSPRHHHRKVPSAAYAGFRGPMSKRDGRFSKDDEHSARGVKYGK
ncbi:MAG: hypothetical protein Q9161_006768 [Pseudevernia consocians]